MSSLVDAPFARIRLDIIRLVKTEKAHFSFLLFKHRLLNRDITEIVKNIYKYILFAEISYKEIRIAYY